MLGNSLYIPLTARCNSITLPQTRGPNFLLPNTVISSLLRVRKAEIEYGHYRDEHYRDDCYDGKEKQLVSQHLFDDVKGKSILPPPVYPIIHQTRSAQNDALSDDKESSPIADSLRQEIQQYLQSTSTNEKQSIVFAGEGEPTLRLNTLLSLSEHIQHSRNPCSDLSIRIVTNGLVLANVEDRRRMLQMLKMKGIDELSVALMTSCSKQYDELMQPNICEAKEKISAHQRICEMIREAVDVGLSVECTGVEHDKIDKSLAESLGDELGANSFRWRPYFP